MDGAVNNIRRGLYGLALLLGALAFLALLDLLFPPRPEGMDRSLLAPIPRVKGAGPGKESLQDYAAIQPGCFLGTVPDLPPRGRRARPGPVPARKLFVLRGTMIHSDPARSCAFIDLPGKEGQQAFFPGDSVQGAKLIEVAADHVLLRKGEQTIKLEVSLEEEAPKGFGPPGQPRSPGEGGQEVTVENLLERYPQIRPFWEGATAKEKDRIRRALKFPPDRRNKVIRAILLRKMAGRRERPGRLQNR